MEPRRSRLSWDPPNLDSPLHAVLLVCMVGILSYLAAKLGGALVLHPQMVVPLWPGCVLLVSVLLLVPRRVWPALIAVAFAAFVVFDLQEALPIRSIALFILADVVEVLTAALCLTYFFDGLPRFDSVKSLAKYSFFAIFLTPFAGAFVGALAMNGNYWTSWRIGFFSEAIGFLTLAPALLSWATVARSWANRPRAYYAEAAMLLVTLLVFGYLAFATAGNSAGSPALLYSLVPLLLWSALRFGSVGVSASVFVIAFLSIWGVVHGRGPFNGPEQVRNVLSLHLFLFCTAVPFMVLAALVEERKQAEEGLRESEERLRLAIQAGRMYAFEWDTSTDAIVRSGKCADIFNWTDDPMHETGRQFVAKVHADDRDAYAATEIGLTPENSTYKASYRVLRPDGSLIWLEESGLGFFDGQGKIRRVIGMVADVTGRKVAEEALSSVSRRLIEAQEQERLRIARELHDDLSQRMALLQIGLEQFGQGMARLSPEARQQLQNIAEVAREVSSDIRDLSHRLHPSKLDLLGLVASLRAVCREFSEQQNLQVQFLYQGIPGQIPKDVTLCLFRIVQEALQNVVKHSGATEADVKLYGRGDGMDLCISDSGRGFDPESVTGAGGLGLISMRERLRLIGGDLTVESKPSHGTRIRVRAPLPPTDAQVTREAKAHKTEV